MPPLGAIPGLGTQTPRSIAAMVGVGGAALLAATGAAYVLEGWLGVADASTIYLLAVVAMAGLYGAWAAILTSVCAFLVYDFLFTEPRLTLTVADPQEWLSLLLFLVVAVVISRLASLLGERAEEAGRRAREAETLFAISRSLATATSVEDAASDIAGRLRGETGTGRVWIVVGAPPAPERVVACAPADAPRPETAVSWILRRQPGEKPAEWVRIHEARRDRRRAAASGGDVEMFRVAIEAADAAFGSIWVDRSRTAGQPGRGATRILSLAADQLGLALRREQLAREATEAEIVRQSDALKSALLDSVSHDLRTPLSSIRAAAGSLMDPAVEWSDPDRRSLARSIDLEAERLSLVVRNLLDLSRIQAGVLVPDIEMYELRELVEPVLGRLPAVSEGRPVTVDVGDDLPPVLVDAVFLDEILTNLLENAARYAPAPAPLRLTARAASGDCVALVVEDGGPGVPDDALEHVFDKFYRVARRGEGARRGMGIGLAVVRGLVEAMGGGVEAHRSELGGLAIQLTVRAEPPKGKAA